MMRLLLATMVCLPACGLSGQGVGTRQAQDFCLAPSQAPTFPDSMGVWLRTPALGFTEARAVGAYDLEVVMSADTITRETVKLALSRIVSDEDRAWAAALSREGHKAPRLLGAADPLQRVSLPHEGYSIMGKDGRESVQADITMDGGLVFSIGRHLYASPAPVFQTTERDGASWRGWWWQPGLSGSGSTGYFCLWRR